MDRRRVSEYDAERRALSVVGRSWAGALVFGLPSLAVRLLLATREQRWQCDWSIRLMSTRQQPLQQCYIMWWVAGALAFLLLPVVVRLLCRALLATWEQRWQCDWPILSAREKVIYYVTIKHLRVRARGDITCEFEYTVHFLRKEQEQDRNVNLDQWTIHGTEFPLSLTVFLLGWNAPEIGSFFVKTKFVFRFVKCFNLLN